MRLDDAYRNLNEQIVAKMYISKKPVISLEIFPPKKNFEVNSDKLIEELKQLKRFMPSYISVTYGAGGTYQDNSFNLALRIKNELNISTMPHFTCVGASKESVENSIKFIEENGIKSILALRGDRPKGVDNFEFSKDFQYANDLVSFIRQKTDLSIGVAGYPEGHTEANCLDLDILNLKKKVDAGAQAVITQVFFNNDHYFRFVEKAKLEGIDVPIVPGILPITSLAQFDKMIALCGASIPEALISRMKKYEGDAAAIYDMGVEYALYQCQQLSDAKVPGIHFYTLNKAAATKEILENLL